MDKRHNYFLCVAFKAFAVLLSRRDTVIIIEENNRRNGRSVNRYTSVRYIVCCIVLPVLFYSEFFFLFFLCVKMKQIFHCSFSTLTKYVFFLWGLRWKYYSISKKCTAAMSDRKPIYSWRIFMTPRISISLFPRYAHTILPHARRRRCCRRSLDLYTGRSQTKMITNASTKCFGGSRLGKSKSARNCRRRTTDRKCSCRDRKTHTDSECS